MMAENKNDFEGLTKEEETQCWKAFSVFDRESSGKINSEELRMVLKMMGQKNTEEEIFRLIAEADHANTGEVTFDLFRIAIQEQKRNKSANTEDDTLDAFVAMGGMDDGDGSIDAKKLIKIIKEEFEMTIDIEQLIKDIDEDGSGAIEYDEFRNLLES